MLVSCVGFALVTELVSGSMVAGSTLSPSLVLLRSPLSVQILKLKRRLII